MDIAPYHLQGCMAEDLLESEYVATSMSKEVSCIGMAAEVSMQSRYSCSFTPAIQYELDGVGGKLSAVQGEK